MAYQIDATMSEFSEAPQRDTDTREEFVQKFDTRFEEENRFTGEANTLTGQMNELSLALEADKESAAQSVVDCQSEVANCQAELGNCQAEVTNCQTELGKCQDEVSNCQDEVANCQAELGNCQDEVSNAQGWTNQAEIYVNSILMDAVISSSTSNLTFTTGAVSLMVETGKNFVADMWLILINRNDPETWMKGYATSYEAGTGALEMAIVQKKGGGSSDTWLVSQTNPAVASDYTPISVKGLYLHESF